ncbi:hypothetical protein ACP70R_003714 [Stipagrostis hirtigluma subsp. patula]
MEDRGSHVQVRGKLLDGRRFGKVDSVKETGRNPCQGRTRYRG